MFKVLFILWLFISQIIFMMKIKRCGFCFLILLHALMSLFCQVSLYSRSYLFQFSGQKSDRAWQAARRSHIFVMFLRINLLRDVVRTKITNNVIENDYHEKVSENVVKVMRLKMITTTMTLRNNMTWRMIQADRSRKLLMLELLFIYPFLSSSSVGLQHLWCR